MEILDWKIIAVRMIVAVILGGIIGLDREKVNQAAGLRTYMLVSVAGTLSSMLSVFISENVGYTDLGRIPAAFISGMGFLGAGAIWQDKNAQVKGITTAAGLWCSAIGGSAIGMGYYIGGVFCYAMAFIIITIVNRMEQGIDRKRDSERVYIEIDCRDNLKNVLYCLDKQGAVISEMNIERMSEKMDGPVAVTMLVNETASTTTVRMLDDINNLDCVTFALYI